MKLSDFTHDRNNNFNIIRILAAYAVLVSHSFPLAMGKEAVDPFHHLLGMTLGTIAVDIFFLVSGFLVTASLLTRQSTVEFVWARVLRIFPALFVMLLLTVFGLGLFFTTDTWSSYLTDPKIYRYFRKCLILIGGVTYDLPGVFEGNPYKNAVNGSLWTMPYELKMYALLAFIWAALRITPRFRPKAFKIAVVSGALLAGLFVMFTHLGVTNDKGLFSRLLFMFLSGAAFFVLRDRIILSYRLFFCFSVIFLLTMFDKQIFFLVYMATLAYLLFFVAYVPAGTLRLYNKLGDYSYGVYIYAFPVQQSVAALLPSVTVSSMVIISSFITLPIAALSWHFLEKHALKQKESCVNHTRKFLSSRLTSRSRETSFP